MASSEGKAEASRPKNHRPLDAVDFRILQLLLVHGRMTYHSLAQTLSIAESTAHARLAALIERRVIRGFHADIDLPAIGFPIQALIQVRVQDRSRALLGEEARRLAQCPGVLEVFFLAGQFDLVIRVACASSEALRDFVLNELNRHPAIAATETSVILEQTPGLGPMAG